MIRIQVFPLEDGAWRVSVGDDKTVPVWGRAPPEAVASARAMAAHARLPSQIGVVGDDLARLDMEERAGRALYAALVSDVEVGRRMGQLEGAGASVILLDDHGTDLPWELLPGPPLVRWSAGPWAPPSPPSDTLVVGAWVLDDAMRELVDELGTAEQGGDLLFLLGHGGARTLTVESGSAAAGSVAAALPGSPRFVVALSCHASVAGGLGPRLIGAGAPACLAPAGQIPVSVAVPAAVAIREALEAGASVLEAVQRGWAVARLIADPHPDARWYQLRLHVSSAQALGPLVTPAATPLGWPPGTADAEVVVRSAWRQATVWGWFGVEALLDVLADSPESARTALFARVVLPELRRRGAALTWERPIHLAPTPRLAVIMAALPQHFNAGDLGAAVATELAFLVAPVRTDLVETAKSVETDPRPALGVEVVGGPEDGRRLYPSSGTVLGRGNGLYEGVPYTDGRLSRRHLTWEGVGRLTLHRATVKHPAGPISLAVNELLLVGGSTLLRGIA